MAAVAQPAAPERSPARWLLSHGATVSALGAVGLYALGVVGTIGQLRASHVDVSQAFSLIPLERNLRIGVSVLFSGAAVYSLIFLAMAAWMFRVARQVEAWSEDPEGNADAIAAAREWRAHRQASRLPTTDLRARSGRLPLRTVLGMWLGNNEPGDRAYRRFCACLLGLGALTRPWPLLPLCVALGGAMLAMPRLVEMLPDQPVSRTKYYVAICVGLTLGVAGVDAYFRSKPLPHVTASTTHGSSISGPLIAVSDGVIYVGATARDRLYDAVPMSQVTRVVVEPRRRVEKPSVLQMLGWDFPRKRCLDPVRPC